jgi:hypothetical protein
MKKVALVVGLILAASPVAAQVGTFNAPGAGAAAPSQSVPTGVICTEEMTAEFCNVPAAPSSHGYSSGSVTAGSSAPPASIPLCPEFPSPNELCN